MEYSYQIFNPSGQLVLCSSASLRYSRDLELDMLDAGYAIKLHGKKLTKTEIRKELKGK